MAIVLDSSNKYADIVLSNGDLTTRLPNRVCPWFTFYNNSKITVNFGASTFTHSVPSGFSAWGSGVTLDSSNKHASITLSNGDLTGEAANIAQIMSVAATGAARITGKYYFEVTIDAGGNPPYIIMGFGPSDMSTSKYPGEETRTWGLHSINGNIYNGGGSSGYGDSFTTSNVIMCAIDVDSGEVWWGEDGSWHASGDPGAGTDEGCIVNQAGQSVWCGVAVTEGKSSGKWYWEVEIEDVENGPSFGPWLMIGAGNMDLATDTYVGSTANGYGMHSYGGDKWTNGGSAGYGNQYTVGDIIMVALDMDNGKIWWGENGTWHISGDPAAGTDYAYTGISGTKGAWINLVGRSKCTVVLAAPFSHSIPSGFSAYDTPSAGWTGKICGVTNPSKICGVLTSDIGKV